MDPEALKSKPELPWYYESIIQALDAVFLTPKKKVEVT